MTDTLQEPLPTPLFEFVGQAFVVRFYRILHGMPSLAHLFYQDISQLCRLDLNGEMTITTTMEGIKEKILSQNYDHYRAQILSVDVQESSNDGVKVYVTGSMSGTNEMARNFEQTFLLAPKEGGYFILNDIFRFVDKDPSLVLENEPMVDPVQIKVEKIVDIMDNAETLVNVQEIPPVEVVDEVHYNSCVVGTEEISLAKVIHEVFNDSYVVDAKDVPLVEMRDDSCVVDTKEVSLPKVVGEVFDDAKEIPRAKVVYEVLDGSCVVDTKEIPLSRVVYEVHDDSCVVDAKEILVAKVVDDVPVDVEEVPLAEVVGTDIVGAWMPSSSAVKCCVKSRNEGSPAGMIGKNQNQNELYMLDKVPHVGFKVDTKEDPLPKVDKVHDSGVIEPNEASLAKVIYEVLDHSCMVKSESKTEEVPMKSHESIENGATLSSYAPPLSGFEPKIQEHQVRHLQPSILGEADAYSIYIKCLPLSVTPSLLEEEFKRFGAIKSGGIQINRNKQGFCFGFVEFEETKSVEKALQAFPVRIDGCQVVVEEKQSSNYRGRRWAHKHEGVKVGGGHFDFPRGRRGSSRWEGLLR